MRETKNFSETKKFMPTRLCLVGMVIAIFGLIFSVWGTVRWIGLENAVNINGLSYSQISELKYVKGNVDNILEAKFSTSSDKYFNYIGLTSDGKKGILDETNSYYVSFDNCNSIISFSVDKLLSPELNSLFEPDEEIIPENEFVGKVRDAGHVPDFESISNDQEMGLEFFFNKVNFNNFAEKIDKDILVINPSNYIIPLWIGLVLLVIGIWIFFLLRIKNEFE